MPHAGGHLSPAQRGARVEWPPCWALLKTVLRGDLALAPWGLGRARGSESIMGAAAGAVPAARRAPAAGCGAEHRAWSPRFRCHERSSRGRLCHRETS